MRVEKVQEFIDQRRFPKEDEFEDLFCDGDKFTEQEDVNWDFKGQWPFSYSDDYFLGIARLVAALANTYGGFIVFGVHDEHRIGGHNKVKTNLDKLRLSISQCVNQCPDIEIKSYNLKAVGKVDCLFVSPRAMGVPPFRFIKETKYKYYVWVREGNEVVKAEPRHLPLIYCRVEDVSDFETSQTLAGSIPPSLRTVEKFIGRMESMDYLFNWLYRSDEPQTYIYGKGGSGKTTVAHEFATILKRFGANIRIYNGDAVDLVLFLSAKEQHFVPGDDSIVRQNEADFSDEKTLYAQLLLYSGLYTTEDKLVDKRLEELRELIVEFFNEFSSVIVLDDIDTLTTKNVEVGTNFLYRTLARAKRTSKILCTQRNIPTHAISNSREVPGLSADEEYPAYVAQCVGQYGVRAPSQQEDRQLAVISERRPLVVEYIIALVRTASTYETAFRLFEGDTGDNIRDYVFRREWASIAYGNDSRNALAALAILNRPVSFDDLLVILQIGEGRLRDAISAVRAMFLQINDAGNETTYSLDVMTRDFVLKEAETIDHIAALRARIRNFEKAYFPEIPQITRLSIRAIDLVRKGESSRERSYFDEAWNLIMSSKLPESLTEHPQFRSVVGFVASKCVPPKLSDARSSFNFVMGTKYEPPIEQLRGWFEAERASGIGFTTCIQICDFVANGRGYQRQDKVDFLSLKATSLHYRGREKAQDEPVEATKLYLEALKLHCLVYKNNIDMANFKAGASERYIRNTAFALFITSTKNMHLDQTIALLSDVLDLQAGYLDPIEGPTRDIFGNIRLHNYEKAVLHRARRAVSVLLSREDRPEIWLDGSYGGRFRKIVIDLDRGISAALQFKS